MTQKLFMLCGLSSLTSLSAQASYKGEINPTRPNILLIVVDDMGFSDTQPFGSEIHTPTLQKLAKQGICFTRFHTSSLSAPTRAMLLTGVDNHQNGLGIMPPLHAKNQYMQPGYEGYLNNKVMTLPEVLKQNHYFTCMAGKWHLGAQQGHTPSDKGFERSFALMGGGAGHFSNAFALSKDEEPVNFYVENGKIVTQLPDDFYSTQYYTDKIIEYLKECPKEKPFFGYLAFTAPHDPLHILPEWKNRYQGQYDCGYDSIRNKRLEKQKTMSLIPENTPYTMLSRHHPQWKDLTQQEKIEQCRKMEIYASMIEYVDYSIGRVLQTLEQEGKADNTLIIFMSDNGANPKEPYAYPGNSKKLISLKYNNNLENYGNADSFISQGGAWAEVCNTPYSLYKMTTGEGGICAPLLISGKNLSHEARIDKRNLLHVTDLFPTILDYAHIQRPDSCNGIKLAPIYGKSFTNLIKDPNYTVRSDKEAICFEMQENKAVIKGQWKAVLLNPPYGDEKKWKLYNLKDDIAEQNDLAGQYPEIVQQLINEWNEYAKSVGYISSDHSSMIKEIGAIQFYKYEEAEF